MPAYDYMCKACGPFTEVRPMLEYALPMACPICRQTSPRALLQVPGIAAMSTGQRKAHATNERSAHAPRVRSGGHGAGCKCCSSGSKRTAPAAAKTFPSARPWMISH